MQETQVQSLGQEYPWRRTGNPLTILTWEIPWTEEPGGLQSMGSQKSWTGLSYETRNHQFSLPEFSRETHTCTR